MPSQLELLEEILADAIAELGEADPAVRALREQVESLRRRQTRRPGTSPFSPNPIELNDGPGSGLEEG